MARKEKEIKCTVEFTPGAIDRITQSVLDNIYYPIRDGLYKDPRQEQNKDETA